MCVLALAIGALHVEGAGAVPVAPAPATEPDATAIEYGLIAALVAVVIIAGLTALGNQLNDKFSNVADTVNSTGSGQEEADTDADGNFMEMRQAKSDDPDSGAMADSKTTLSGNEPDMHGEIRSKANLANSSPNLPGPDAGLSEEASIGFLVLAPRPPNSPDSTAHLELAFEFVDVAIGIDGPVPFQDFALDLVAPGLEWGFTVVHSPVLDRLELTGLRGSARKTDVIFAADGRSIVGIQGPTVAVDVPWDTETLVTFGRRQVANSSAFHAVPEPVTVLLLGVALCALAAAGRAGSCRQAAVGCSTAACGTAPGAAVTVTRVPGTGSGSKRSSRAVMRTPSSRATRATA